MPSLNHTHTYRRVSFKERQVFMCDHPDCSTRELKRFLLGKRSICNECGEDFILDSYALRRAKPKCEKCRNTKDAVETKERKQSLEKLKII